jgi:hypothetical protein
LLRTTAFSAAPVSTQPLAAAEAEFLPKKIS